MSGSRHGGPGPRPVVAIVQARMGSTRLPGKVLLPLAGQPMLHHIIARLRRCPHLDQVVIATSRAESDAAVAEFAARAGVPCYRGSEQDVLDRYRGAAEAAGAGHVVRITADCPCVDPEVVGLLVGAHLRSGADYTSNTLQRSFPHGADVEVFTAAALQAAAAEAVLPAEREHVTPFIWGRPERFRLHNVTAEGALAQPQYRLTVDTEEDYMLARAIYELLDGDDFSLADVVALFERQPWLPYINRQVQQKVVINEPDPERALGQECLVAARWAERQDLHRVSALLRAAAAERGVN